ncbi:DoxX family protein [Mucilaginibacter sp. ZT4R22]|uniref:DoxX family protein n=1 Tax=Mucilaginibacter pankratovii TaxID=2772110 RepID=A0ABR7WKX3_9SPHI|nr:DoxX family protein [Mucilaginibacter pankratovii]MBD1362971.1 DoxX family protein [Mucilaginibacter pankratovii]
MRNTFIIEIISTLLVILFTYTAVSKLMDLPVFRDQMHNQEFPKWIAGILIMALPPTEIVTAVLLIIPRARLTGLWFSAILLTLFSGYITLVVAGFYRRTPCSCGGVLKSMGWNTHLIFNLFFLLLTCFAISICNRGRRNQPKN